MAFTPILTDQSISYAENRPAYYRNSRREDLWGSPVYFVPPNYDENQYGEPGPKYAYGYNYNNSTSNYLGNCTWWCMGRLLDAGYNGSITFGIGDAKNWYSNYSGNKDTNVNNLRAGDIIVFEDANNPGDSGHVMFVEQISGSTVRISQSAYSTRSVWSGKSCLVNTYIKSELSYGNNVDMYRNIGSAYYEKVIGFLHTSDLIPSTISIIPLYRNLFLKRRKRRGHVTIW